MSFLKHILIRSLHERAFRCFNLFISYAGIRDFNVELKQGKASPIFSLTSESVKESKCIQNNHDGCVFFRCLWTHSKPISMQNLIWKQHDDKKKTFPGLLRHTALIIKWLIFNRFQSVELFSNQLFLFNVGKLPLLQA